MQTEELLSKLDQIEEHASHTLKEFPQHLTKERQQMIIALVKQVRWLVAEDVLSRTDPEATVRMQDE
jgi:Fe2+ or Zn2+ uptake regulation protein